jgi:diketogulonate reductase-like aldo/keto reductase
MEFSVQGQQGTIPSVGLGTATLFDKECTDAVRAAIQLGYRHIDTALLYNNQEAVGLGIRQAIEAGEVKREELFVTSKVGFYPRAATPQNVWVPIEFHPENVKGDATAAVDLCLSKLGLDYVDLMLIHNPCTDLDEYAASGCPHAFELSNSMLTEAERQMVLHSRLEKVTDAHRAAGHSDRTETWLSLVAARQAGKCKFIGVSNYPPKLLEEMADDPAITVMPAVNQLELHPRFSSPALRRYAADTGMVLTGYGSGNSTRIGASPVVAGIAERLSVSPLAVVLKWTVCRDVGCIPRTATPGHMEENLKVLTDNSAVPLSEEDLSALDQLNQAHCYYWSPLPCLPVDQRQPDM